MDLRRALLTMTALSLSPVSVLAEAPPPQDPTRFPSARRTILDRFQAGSQEKIKIAFFDADSTLRVAPSGKVSANSPTDVAILPMVARAIARLEEQGYLIAIVSNQGGVAQGFITIETADAALITTMSRLSRLGVTFHYYDFAEKEDQDRKPDIGMGRRLALLIEKKLGKRVDWEGTIMVGDSAWKKGVDVEPDGSPGEDFSNSDRLFAQNLSKAFGGVTFHHPRDYFHWVRYGIRNFPTFKSLLAFVAQHPQLDPGVN